MMQLSWAKFLLLLPFSLMAYQLVAHEQQAVGAVLGGTGETSELMSSDQADRSPSSTPEAPYDTTPQHPPKTSAYNAPVLLNPHAWANVYVTGSYLYWRASADYLAYGFLDNSFSPNPGDIQNILFNGKALEPHFRYKPGYKLGLGYKLHRDRWDLYAEYTQFHQTTHSSKTVQPGGQHIHAVWLIFVAPVIIQDDFQSCSSKWKTNFDILDVEVGRNFFCGRYLTFRPSLGLRTLWLEQKYDLTYVSFRQAIPVFGHNKSRSWGIGPRCGLDSAWNLYGGLKAVGNVAISLLHVEDRVRVKQSIPFLLTQGLSDDTIYANKESISLIKPILDLSLGLGWEWPFRREKYALNLEVTYDYSLYWDQGSIQLGHAPLVAPGSPIQVVVGNAALSTGDISVQGAKATVRFDF